MSQLDRICTNHAAFRTIHSQANFMCVFVTVFVPSMLVLRACTTDSLLCFVLHHCNCSALQPDRHRQCLCGLLQQVGFAHKHVGQRPGCGRLPCTCVSWSGPECFCLDNTHLGQRTCNICAAWHGAMNTSKLASGLYPKAVHVATLFCWRSCMFSVCRANSRKPCTVLNNVTLVLSSQTEFDYIGAARCLAHTVSR